MSKQLEKTLKTHDLRITQMRMEVLEFFQKNKKALSHADLETAFDQKADRVTIYRTLNSFLEKGVLHKVLDDSGSAKYALCDHHESEVHEHTDNHVHFKCRVCQKIECLHNLQIPLIKLPKNYHMESSNVLLEGVCPLCFSMN